MSRTSGKKVHLSYSMSKKTGVVLLKACALPSLGTNVGAHCEATTGDARSQRICIYSTND